MFAKLMKNPSENWGGWISLRCCQQSYRFKSHWCWWQYLFYGFSRWNFASSPFFNRRELLRGVVKFSLCDCWLSWCSVILTATENFTKGWLPLKLPIWVGVGGLELAHLACLISIFEKNKPIKYTNGYQWHDILILVASFVSILHGKSRMSSKFPPMEMLLNIWLKSLQ